MRITVFHPGAMGSKLAAQLVVAGHEVHWVPDGRSAASKARADMSASWLVTRCVSSCATVTPASA